MPIRTWMRCVFRQDRVALGQAALQGHGAFDRIDDARELRQQPVAHQLEDAAVALLDLRLEQLLAAGFQALEGSRLVLLHQSRVADDVGGEDRRKFSFQCRPPSDEAGRGAAYTVGAAIAGFSTRNAAHVVAALVHSRHAGCILRYTAGWSG